MGVFVIKNAQIYLGNYDISGDSNQVGLSYEGEEVDSTTMGPDGAREFLAGLLVNRLTASGFVNYVEGGSDEALFGKIGETKKALTIGPESGTDGAVVFFTRANQASYDPGATAGELMAFSLNAVGTDKLIRGRIMASGKKDESGTGVIRELGAVSATQKLYAALHVFSADGVAPTLDVKVQSDSSEDFLAPIDVIEFAQVEDEPASEFKVIDGPITDTWFRIDYTIDGTNPEYSFVVVIGIA